MQETFRKRESKDSSTKIWPLIPLTSIMKTEMESKASASRQTSQSLLSMEQLQTFLQTVRSEFLIPVFYQMLPKPTFPLELIQILLVSFAPRASPATSLSTRTSLTMSTNARQLLTAL